MEPAEAPVPRFLAQAGYKGMVYREPYGVALVMGPFNGYERNHEPFLRVIKKHGSHVAKIDPAHVPLDLYNAGELSPGPSVESDEEILAWVAKDSETALHPSCTCRLGTGEASTAQLDERPKGRDRHHRQCRAPFARPPKDLIGP